MGVSQSTRELPKVEYIRRRRNTLDEICEKDNGHAQQPKYEDTFRRGVLGIKEPKIHSPPPIFLSASQIELKHSWDEFFEKSRDKDNDYLGVIFTEHSTTVPSVGSQVSIFRTDRNSKKTMKEELLLPTTLVKITSR